MGSHRVEHDWSDLAAAAASPSSNISAPPKGEEITLFFKSSSEMLTFHNCNFTSLFSQFLWETCKFIWDLHIEVVSEIKQIPIWTFKVQEDPLEKEIATHSSISCWKIPWTEVDNSPWGHKKVKRDMETEQHHPPHTLTQDFRHHPNLYFLLLQSWQLEDNLF